MPNSPQFAGICRGRKFLRFPEMIVVRGGEIRFDGRLVEVNLE
jgi:hypothetical protein